MFTGDKNDGKNAGRFDLPPDDDYENEQFDSPMKKPGESIPDILKDKNRITYNPADQAAENSEIEDNYA